MQQPLPPMSAVPAPSITTEQIQKYLDENKQLILAILENQNLGKLAECAQYQAQLQKNLLYLAAIADAQPQGSAARPQGALPQGALPQGAFPQGALPQGAFPQGALPQGYMQQSPIFPPRAPVQFNPHQMQDPQQNQHHQTPGMPSLGQMGMRPGTFNGMHNMQAEPFYGGNTDIHPSQSLAELQRSGFHGHGGKQDGSGAASESTGAEGRSSGNEQGSGSADQTSKTP